MVGSFFIFAKFCWSANSDIIINEIGAYATSTHEWIEIWNKGSDSVDLSGWKFWENNTNHGLSVSTTDSIIDSGEYAVICQDANQFLVDFPSFSGSIFDSSWSGLNESGEEIGIKDSENNFIEQFSYVSAINFSLERKNPYLLIYDNSNWQEHLSGNTVGFINSVYTDEIINNNTSTIGIATTTPEEPVESVSDILVEFANPLIIWPQIKINEFVSNPESGNEWVELYNLSTSSLNLTGGLICDSRESTSTCKNISGTIFSGGWFLIDLAGNSYLNNDGDSVVLRNLSGEIVDRIDYGADLLPNKNQALGRKIDGVDSDSPADWSITTQLTPGAVNVIVLPVITHQSSSGSGGASDSQVQTLPAVFETSDRISYGVVINEIFPNPSGPDVVGEFIEIKNISNSMIDLSGWKIGDAVQTFSLSGIIFPQQIVSWPRSLTKISLNNTTKETVKLYNEKNETIDAIEYDRAKESESYCRNIEGKWLWSSKPTSGTENEIIQIDNEIILKINAPAGGEIGEMLIFDAEDSFDRRGGELNFVWNFGDGEILFGGEVERVFSTSGVFAILISATSTNGSGASKIIEVIIGRGLSANNTGIIISEILSNPAGDDLKEFVEIYNSGESVIDLSGWRLRRQNGQEYIFPVSTKINADSYLVFDRAVTRFSLNNQGDKIELLTRDSQTVDLIKFGTSPSGKSYSVFADEWQWTIYITPGQINQSDEELSDGGNYLSDGIENFSTLTEARLLDGGEKIITRGTVTVLPGVFGVQFFYLGDENGGIQVYNYKKDFPPLKIGDFIEVSGEISVNQNIKRIKITNSEMIDVLELEKFLDSQPCILSDLQEEKLGSLIKISGEITEIKTSGMYVDDGQDEIMIYFKQGAKINKKQFQEGMNVSVVGILEEKSGDFQLWPRSTGDIQLIGMSEDLIKKEVLAAADVIPKKNAENYLTATIGGLTALLLGFIGRAKGTVLKTVAKKTGALVLGAVFKRKV
ncbi:MAG: hypothetical protein COU29_02040 [Candidatus Magasanikbacteria bacterium CG10_big_fil_rev_8_21_14_0_10_36_32]|uniref:PKD domain-containing protein n=1 Tax=Candidatus Magasanikbacteria bacterium CG10_big_fil_rev_8_21_14_0_10_36_32 TaxID=1974646 RepID=A0A2M6W6W8_9BACT|nr:MAG: hypothetical protein COU29_02040 [Candidatus Magasanikbacteria bacterium CG10_big_fil_rev_8_21_14_0_10_36_32]